MSARVHDATISTVKPMLKRNQPDGTVEYHAGRWYYVRRGKWVRATGLGRDKLDAMTMSAMVVNALIMRSIWDYSHRRSCFLADSSSAVISAGRFLFGRDGLEKISRVGDFKVDVERVRDLAIVWRERIEERRMVERRRYKTRWEAAARKAGKWIGENIDVCQAKTLCGQI